MDERVIFWPESTELSHFPISGDGEVCGWSRWGGEDEESSFADIMEMSTYIPVEVLWAVGV